MTPYIYIQNFRNELGGFDKPINPIIFCTMLANKFNGEMFVMLDEEMLVDIVVKIKDKFYDADGIVDEESLDIHDFIKYDKLSVLYDASAYNQIKWWFLLEEKI